MPKRNEVMTVEFDPTKPPYKQPKRPAEPSEEQPKEVPKLREISFEELKDILEKHKKWLKSKRKEGQQANLFRTNLHRTNLDGALLQEATLDYADLTQANLSKANLQRTGLLRTTFQKADLSNANLQEAILENANLQEATLCGADLREATLSYANLQGANLFKANLQGADLFLANFENTNLLEATLREADLQNAKVFQANGLQSNQFAGANVSGAKLPDNITKFEGLGQVEKISQRAQKLFLSLLLGCVYCWLTIATTTDVGLITNSGSSPLPIIQTKIPIAYFYWAAPLILLCLYLWFHLYLQRMWERLSQLPAVFTDGEALDEKVYPWLISGMVSLHVRLLKENRPALSRIQTGISILLAWWLVPFTFLFFWLRYIPRHDWVGTALHVGALGVSITAAFLLYRLAAKTLRGEKTSSLSWKENVKRLPAYQHASLTLGILGLCFLTFSNLSTWAIEGVPPRPIDSWSKLFTPPCTNVPYEWCDGPILVPRFFDYFGYRTHANLNEIEISTKPPTWTGQKEEPQNEISLVKGANLQNANLQNAKMQRAFLVKADLRGANLKGADLYGANLQEADLGSADLQEADLRVANLTGVRNLSAYKLCQARVDEDTILPDSLTLSEKCLE